VDKTQSPWLFYELGTMRIIRRKKPARVVRLQLENLSRGEIVKASKDFRAEYEVPLNELTPLTSDQLIAWQKQFRQSSPKRQNALDLLYEIAPEND
jgi:hypothetical protein